MVINDDHFGDKLKDRTIIEVERQGKAIIMRVSQKAYLLVNLGMTGRLIFFPDTAPIDKHTHILFFFSQGGQLIYHDLRQFGRLQLHEGIELWQIPFVKGLGPDPLDADFTWQHLAQLLSKSSRAIKDFLLDQKRIAGIGNIYASETLFHAAIKPLRKANQLRMREIKRLRWAMQEVLRAAVEHRGTSFSDYLDVEGKKGNYKHFLQVYSREREACFRCATKIVRTKLGNRSTYYCPTCQK
jgi:formamidopyrimidine-DNA glycosylase